MRLMATAAAAMMCWVGLAGPVLADGMKAEMKDEMKTETGQKMEKMSDGTAMKKDKMAEKKDGMKGRMGDAMKGKQDGMKGKMGDMGDMGK